MDYRDTTVIIPVKEEPEVAKVARDVIKTLHGCDVIVIHKGQLKMPFKYANMKVVAQTGSGKGVGMVQAEKLVKTPIMCFIDGDNTYDVRDLKKVVTLVRAGADMALGDRMSHLDSKAMESYVQFGNRVLTLVANVLYGLRIKDSQTGLRAIRTNVFRSLNLQEPQFGIEEEMNIKVQKRGLKIVETPIKYYVRNSEAKHAKPFGGLKLLFINFKFLGNV